MMLDKSDFSSYRNNKCELALIEASLIRLDSDLKNVQIVSGKVTKSSDEFPYIEEHMSVEMADPKKADRIRRRIFEKESRKTILMNKIKMVEDFIDSMEPGIDKEIFEMLYYDGMTQKEVGETVGLERSVISKHVTNVLKFAHLAHS